MNVLALFLLKVTLCQVTLLSTIRNFIINQFYYKKKEHFVAKCWKHEINTPERL